MNNEEQYIITNENKPRTRRSNKNKESNVQVEENTSKSNVIENTNIAKEEISNVGNTIEDINENEDDDPFAML